MASRRRKVRKSPQWELAPDITTRTSKLISLLELNWIKADRVYCFRSYDSSARAYARIWGFQKIWQLALDQEPAYALEILSENFDHLKKERQDEILLHELAHIPQTFSGALLPHTRRGKGSFHGRLKQMETAYKKLRKSK